MFNEKKSKFLICLFISLQKVELLCRYVGSSLCGEKQHIRNIRFYVNLIYFLYLNKLVQMKGFKLYISGKLNGKMKHQKYSYKLGKICLITFDTLVNFFYLPLYTKFGVLSIKM
jgi:hypothetical protein